MRQAAERAVSSTDECMLIKVFSFHLILISNLNIINKHNPYVKQVPFYAFRIKITASKGSKVKYS